MTTKYPARAQRAAGTARNNPASTDTTVDDLLLSKSQNAEKLHVVQREKVTQSTYRRVEPARRPRDFRFALCMDGSCGLFLFFLPATRCSRSRSPERWRAPSLNQRDHPRRGTGLVSLVRAKRNLDLNWGYPLSPCLTENARLRLRQVYHNCSRSPRFWASRLPRAKGKRKEETCHISIRAGKSNVSIPYRLKEEIKWTSWAYRRMIS